MKATQQLHDLGQSIWLDNITRDLLTSGTLKRYISELSLTGLTSNPTIFDQAISRSSAYDAAIRGKKGTSAEKLFFDLAIEDLSQAADMFRPVWDRTRGVDGWVSLEVSPLLAYDSAGTTAAAKELHARAQRSNRPSGFTKAGSGQFTRPVDPFRSLGRIAERRRALGCFQLHDHSGESLSQRVVNVARHPVALRRDRSFTALFRQSHQLETQHGLMRHRPRQLDFFLPDLPFLFEADTEHTGNLAGKDHRDA